MNNNSAKSGLSAETNNFNDPSQENNDINNSLSLQLLPSSPNRPLNNGTKAPSADNIRDSDAPHLSLAVPPPESETPPEIPEGEPAHVKRVRRNPTQAPHDATKSEIIPQPYPWATTKRATVHTLSYLRSKQILTIWGRVQCKRCEQQYDMEFDLHDKFMEIGSFMVRNRSTMHDRAPADLMNPKLPTCQYCNQENSVKPLISEKKKTINWLFLLLGQMLGCCTLEQLKYFCKHTKNHRTGAKDRVLYLTYLAICKQLDPDGPFDH